MPTHQPDAHPGSPSPLGSQLVLLALIVVAALVVYNLFMTPDRGRSPGISKSAKEIQLNFVPSDFKPNLDEKATLQILTQPQRYRREFNDLVYNTNLSLLYHVANRMGFPDTLRYKLEGEYKKHHEYLSNLYFHDFVQLKDTSASMYETWYNDEANQAVELFNEVAGKYTCFFVTQITSVLLQAGSTRLYGKGKTADNPCAIAVDEGLRPMVARLRKQADIVDFSQSQGLLKQRVRRSIAELATYEYQSQLGLDKTLNYKILGVNVSGTDIRIEAVSILKAGFKLDRQFDVSLVPSQNKVVVTLPSPVVLSHEVYPRIEKLDVGFLAGIKSEELNAGFNELRRQFRREAIEEERVLDRARMRADSVMQLILGPTVRAMGKQYRMELRFDAAPTSITEDDLRRQGISPDQKTSSSTPIKNQ